MSLGAVKWARSIQGIPPLEKYLLETIADFYNDKDHRAWPGRTVLNERTSISIRQISRLLKSLENRGLIRVQRWINSSSGMNLNNRYFLPEFDPKGSAADPRTFVHTEPNFDNSEGKVSFIDDYKEQVG